MIVLAKGSITKPEALAPYVDDEMRVVGELKDEGVTRTLYRRSAGPGVYLILEGPDLEVMRDRIATLPFVTQGLLTLEFDEVYEL